MFRISSHTLSAVAISALAVSALCTASQAVMANPVAASAQQASAPQIQERATLTVTVTGFVEEAGQLMVALADEEGYQGGNPVRGTMAAVNAKTVTLTFENLPTGTYAIRMFHDVDGNGEMNTNAFGIPTEPFAFSNNAKAVMGPATWEDAQFEHGSDGTVQAISF